MGAVDNQINWRKVFQDDAADLKCTNTPDGVTSQPVHQGDASLLNVTSTPAANSIQEVRPAAGIKGIWAPEGSVRVNEAVQSIGEGGAGVYTVPANKILFIATAGLTTSLSTDQVSVGGLQVRDEGDALAYSIMLSIFAKAGQAGIFSRFSPALEVEAGWDVFVSGSHADMVARALFFGWLEDA